MLNKSNKPEKNIKLQNYNKKSNPTLKIQQSPILSSKCNSIKQKKISKHYKKTNNKNKTLSIS